ncbi:hypothetical protein PoB_001392200 [Plakobranchus ocellatus]|uniref:Uncharacterized protein n=1 Tax=Plakobranchus ocellatus TaxID=259542 RepID=A0AAV3YYM2_9GAST|nr:hypothetical protein PoB_001392200 [Plakobranchus ocellatus]
MAPNGDDIKKLIKDVKEQRNLAVSAASRPRSVGFPGFSHTRPFLGKGNPRFHNSKGRGQWTNHRVGPTTSKAKRGKQYQH